MIRSGQIRGPFENSSTEKSLSSQNLKELILHGNNEYIYKIGIQSDPGTIFNINGIDIEIGYTGVYELKDTQINTFTFNMNKNKVYNENKELIKDFNNENIIIDFFIKK